MWAGLFLWNNGTAMGWCGWKVSHLKHPLHSLQCQWDHITLTEKQVSHDDLVVVNKASLFPDFTLKKTKRCLAKMGFFYSKNRLEPDIFCSHQTHIYILYMAVCFKNCPFLFRATTVLKHRFSKISLLPSFAGTIILTQLPPASTSPRNKVGAVWVCVRGWKIP